MCTLETACDGLECWETLEISFTQRIQEGCMYEAASVDCLRRGHIDSCFISTTKHCLFWIVKQPADKNVSYTLKLICLVHTSKLRDLILVMVGK